MQMIKYYSLHVKMMANLWIVNIIDVTRFADTLGFKLNRSLYLKIFSYEHTHNKVLDTFQIYDTVKKISHQVLSF